MSSSSKRRAKIILMKWYLLCWGTSNNIAKYIDINEYEKKLRENLNIISRRFTSFR